MPALTILSPVEYGLPDKFTAWRASQFDAINRTVDSPQRFVCLCAPTGWGKSLYYMAAAKMSGARTVILTSTKGLQDQLKRDFDTISADIRGMQNYPCSIATEFGFPAYTRVADAPCQAGAHCLLRAGGCEYFDQYREAQQADIIVTNYQCWFYDRHKKKGNLRSERPIDLLVIDEAHESMTELAGYLEVELERRHCLSMGVTWPNSGYTQPQWTQWAEHWRGELEERQEQLEESIRQLEKGRGAARQLMQEIKEVKKLAKELDKVAGMQGEWVVEEIDPGNGTMARVRFDPLWPREYAERVLFRDIGKVVLVSATARPKTAHLLGIGDDQMAFEEYPSSFPVERRPVIHVPTVRVNYHTERDDGAMMWWLRRIDTLIGQRLDRRGIVHTVSYKRARFIKDNSRYTHLMLIHGSDNRAEILEKFRASSPGTVLVSPSVDTGYDFPYDAAEYQIIAKLPFPDTRDKVMKARTAEDKLYGPYMVAQTIQQMTGRLMRAEDDMGETIVIDDNIGWFVSRYRQFFNKWWLDAFWRQQAGMPTPLEKL